MMAKYLSAVIMLITLVLRADYTEPLYVVETASDTVLMDDTEITLTQGGVTSTASFGDLSLTQGTFVKRGAGMLTGSVALGGFTGSIVIEEGAYLVNTNGMLGPQNSTAGDVIVKRGASLVLGYDVSNHGKIHNTIHIAGDGAPGFKGAVVNRCSKGQQDYLFYRNWYIEDDATIYADQGASRIDWNGVYVYLKGHTLTIKGYDNGRTFCFSGVNFSADGDGHIIADCVAFQTQSTGKMIGSAQNTITFKNGASLNYYGIGTQSQWTLVWDETGTVSPGGSPTFNGAFGRGAVIGWTGPVEIRGRMNISANWQNTAYLRGYGFGDTLTGAGDIVMTGGWVNLYGSTNTMTGSMAINQSRDIYDAGLLALNDKVINPASRGLALTNAPLALYESDRNDYTLPQLTFHVATDTEQELVNVVNTNVSYAATEKLGGANMTAVGLRKTGNGTLVIKPALAVTGTTEIVSGTVRIAPIAEYSGAPGLYEGVMETNAEMTAYYATLGAVNNPIYQAFSANAELPVSRVTTSPYFATKTGSPWHMVHYIRYSGYIWNRGTETSTWSFAGSIHDAVRLIIDGSRVFSIYDSNNMTVNSKAITPGPHKIDIYMWNYNGNNSNSGAMKASKNGANWRLGMGFAIDFQGRGSYNADDYVFPMNNAASCAGGDGFLFTLDNRLPEAFTPEEYASTRTSFSNLVMHAGATLDIVNGTNFVNTIRGVGSIINGSLNVAESLEVTLDDVISGTALSIPNGSLELKPNATIKIVDDNIKPSANRTTNQFIVATTQDGIVGDIELENDYARWNIKKSADGKSLIAVYNPPGLIITFR